jgi:hypothetical protein
MEILHELQKWFSAQCNGDWEHRYGINITTCDNPGWWVKINLEGTSLSNKHFETKAENLDSNGFAADSRWFKCHVENNVWNGAGDETKLEMILQSFLSWAS